MFLDKIEKIIKDISEKSFEKYPDYDEDEFSGFYLSDDEEFEERDVFEGEDDVSLLSTLICFLSIDEGALDYVNLLMFEKVTSEKLGSIQERLHKLTWDKHKETDK